jgi:hypothetical protein
MYNDLVTKALDQAKALQKTVVEAVGKRADQAHPLIDEAVTKAKVLRETLVHGAADATEGARPHLEGALTHVNSFIAMGKDALATGVAKAHEQLGPLTEQVKKTLESTTAAMGKKPEDASHEKDAAPR